MHGAITTELSRRTNTKSKRGEEKRDKETIPQEEESEAGKGKFRQRSQAVGLEKRLLRGGFVVVYRARGGWEVVLITMPRSVAIAVIQPQT